MSGEVINLNTRRKVKSEQWFDHPDDPGNIILQRRKKEGLCIGCGQEKPVKGDDFCQMCIDEENLYRNERR
jgi:hypothetical protein